MSLIYNLFVRMSKILVYLALLMVSSLCMTNQEIIQQGLNGGFEQNWLPRPTTIIPCIDEATAKQIVDYIG